VAQVLAPAPTSFIGREKETAEIARLLTGAGRLLTLTGPAGVGKTRLALEAAAGMGGQFAHGVMCVSLAPLRDRSLVVAALAAALGVPERQGRSRLDSLKEALRDRSQLLVLDNFEQVLPAAPVLVELVIACPGLRLLVTSRAALRVSGEQEFVVSPLRLPGPGAAMHNPAELGRVEAVQLFVDRARAVRSDFALSEQTAGAVADICERLDGLPLAIELAAAWARVLEPPELRARLQHRLPLLMAGARDLPPRQQTLRAAIGWSYELLDADERRLFRQLAVFAGRSGMRSRVDPARPGAAGRAEPAASRANWGRAALRHAGDYPGVRPRAARDQRRGGRPPSPARQLLPPSGRDSQTGAEWAQPGGVARAPGARARQFPRGAAGGAGQGRCGHSPETRRGAERVLGGARPSG
jgi:hypothetical protein